jgi:hypothetical protein
MSGKRSTVYSADAWTFNFAGLPIESGKGKDEFLKIEQQDDDFTYTGGLDGEGVFNQMMNNYTTCSLTLLQTSAGNALLSAIHIVSRQTPGGQPGALFVKDRLGTSTMLSAAAMILKMPDEAAGKEADVIVWKFGVHDPDRFVGSH